jgi:predicted RNase H-like HicB family nuclease
MLDLGYSLVIEATDDPNFFGFFSPDLEGFTGVGHSVEDCLYQARWGMKEHVELLEEQGLPVPPKAVKPDRAHSERGTGCLSRRGQLPWECGSW